MTGLMTASDFRKRFEKELFLETEGEDDPLSMSSPLVLRLLEALGDAVGVVEGRAFGCSGVVAVTAADEDAEGVGDVFGRSFRSGTCGTGTFLGILGDRGERGDDSGCRCCCCGSSWSACFSCCALVACTA